MTLILPRTQPWVSGVATAILGMGASYLLAAYSLVHDFFHVVTDNRNNGDPLHTCTETPQNTLTESAAYGTTSGSNYIRPTLRSDRDFSLWWPSETSGTFGEAHMLSCVDSRCTSASCLMRGSHKNKGRSSPLIDDG